MKPKHTAGTWKVSENGLAGYGDNGNNFKIVVRDDEDGDEITIADLPYAVQIHDRDQEGFAELKANAYLIAAAPAMRAFLVKEAKAYKHEDGSYSELMPEGLLELIALSDTPREE